MVGVSKSKRSEKECGEERETKSVHCAQNISKDWNKKYISLKIDIENILKACLVINLYKQVIISGTELFEIFFIFSEVFIE